MNGPPSELLVVDDFARRDRVSRLGPAWRGVSDRVMGGISQESVEVCEIDGRRCLRLTGDVRLENDGGFIQMALDLAGDGSALDVALFAGLLLLVRGNGEVYGAHLRTPDAQRPWQSYRAQFQADPIWREVRIPFGSFLPHRLSTPLDASRLCRLGLVAIGRAFQADLAVGRVAFYR